ncbi:undecaprenyl-phosphate glucose phosphotransferase [Maribacter polysaccharolyticus]|uniref:undecaprenyl-phosphate glucose phosphotransferase n=1 Tax=Maribacter polysaccharolyticus TaxID=3020831 RepID=UPI00237F3A8E|nr:undecaprenyl-phosphate glucose phosphotransferase [Maribacter polysaccharolyticus]MDE3741470.1 undecaprenyl-phosphate glucose phosphotransferase [Maribacter polysaccharolyticus]
MEIRSSYFIIPLSLVFHIATINLTLYIFTPETYFNVFSIVYLNTTWVMVTHMLDFYPTARREGFMTHLGNFFRLFFFYAFVYYALFALLDYNPYSIDYLFQVYLFICTLFTLYRMFFFWARNKYRTHGGNSVKVVVIGRDRNLKKIRHVFDNSNFGYRYLGYFDNYKSKSPTYLGDINTAFTYIFENEIDEVYCMASRLSKEELQQLMSIADNSLKRIKIIPDNKELISRAMSIELYDSVPVLNLRASPLEMEYATMVKRIFDIVFSSFVIVFVLSWLTPLVLILLKIDSKGPLFFKQKRHGVNRQSFWCYKFRSMTQSKESDTMMATKNDMRITRVGRILRKTSIDELPQFFNVLKGDMSVVGPRPHMEFHTQQFEKSVDKYLVRHFLKPGITGLAQIKGYRGEIVEQSDIVNRVRYDIFYLEKWSILLDFRIIFDTVFNAVRGEEKAY